MTNHIPTTAPLDGVSPVLPAFCLGLGQFDSRKPTFDDGRPNPKAGQPYGLITLDEVAAMVQAPPVAVKGSGAWMLASAYSGEDARSFNVQAEQGRFHAMLVDLDKGNLPLDWIKAAVVALLPGVRALIYSSASARPDNRKWHIVVPMAMPIPYKAFRAFEQALFHGFEHNGAQVDHSLARSAQLYYLPSVPFHSGGLLGDPYYEWADLPGELFTPDRDHTDFRRLAQTYFLREQEEAPAESKGHGPHSIIGWVARNLHTEDLLVHYGYSFNGKDWASPMQRANGSRHGTLLRDDGTWASMSESDRAAGIGKPARKSDARWGDAFDLIKFYAFGNDEEAALCWAYEQRRRANAEEHAELHATVGRMLQC